jgi:hypothetical protein
MGNYAPRDQLEKDLLDRARREYPIGTIYEGLDYIGTRLGREWEVEREPRIYTIGNDLGDIYIEGGYDYIFVRGTWAKIIEPPVINQDNYLVFN